MTADVIEIDRLPIEIEAVTTRARAELLTRRIQSAVTHTLPGALAAFRPQDVLADDAYVFVDRLDIRCGVSTHWSDDLVGRAVGQALLTRLHQQLESGTGVRFADRTEYVSAFLVALLDGGAFSRWWFAEFDGLKPLPLSTAMRTLTINEGETGIAALTRLTGRSFREVFNSITETDAGQLLSWLTDHRGDTASVDITTLCSFTEHTEIDNSNQNMAGELSRWIALERVAETRVGATDLSRLNLVLKMFAAASAGQLKHVWRDADTQKNTLLGCLLDLDDYHATEWPFSEDECTVLLERLREQGPAADSDEVREETVAVSSTTPFGGALLLLVRLLRLGWWQRWWAALKVQKEDAPDAELCAVLGLAVVARALEPDNTDAVQTDNTLRDVFGIHASEPVSVLCRKHERLFISLLAEVHAPDQDANTPNLEVRLTAAAAELLEQFAAKIPGCAGSTHEYLRSQCLTMPASVVFAEHTVRARLGVSPLDVLLILAGTKRTSAEFQDGRKLFLDGDLSS